MSNILFVINLGQTSKPKTPLKASDKYREELAERESKMYSLASEANRAKERPGRTEQFEQAKVEGTQRAQEKYEYHIKNLENDKASLSKRYILTY